MKWSLIAGWFFILLIFFPTGNLIREADAADINRFGGKYNVPLSSEPRSLDPAYITDIYGVTVANNLYDGLVEFDQNLNIVPAIADIWKISRDHRTYTFQLKEGVKFHNGREVTAEDFVFSLRRILHPETRSPVASFFLDIKGAEPFHAGDTAELPGLEVLGPYTLKIILEQPFSPFLSILAMANAKVVPKEAFQEDFNRHPIGSGPFQFQSWETGKAIVLTANEQYHTGRPYLDSLYFQIYPHVEWEKVFADFERGFLEQSIIPSGKYEQIISDNQYSNRYTLVSHPALNLVYIGMNLNFPPLDDIRVRKAIAYAVDTEAIVQGITKRGSIPALGILPPGIAGYDPDFVKYRHNPEKSRQLLQEAGFSGGKEFPVLEMWTGSKADSVQEELKAYQTYLAEVGINIVPRTADNWKHFTSVIDNQMAPLFYAAWYADFPDPDNFLYVLCHSESRTNRMGYHRPEVDHALEVARRESDYLERIRMYRDIQKEVMEDVPIIPQHVNSFNYLLQPWVKGFEINYLGVAYIPYKKLWLDFSNPELQGKTDKRLPQIPISKTKPHVSSSKTISNH